MTEPNVAKTPPISAKKVKVLGVLLSIGAVIALYFAYQHYMYVTTDNAQINAHVVMLSSRVNGTIKKVFVQENQKIKQGEVLAQIDTSDYSNASEAASAQVLSLQARFREAEGSFKRASELFKTQVITREQFDAAQASYKDIAAKLKASQAQLDQAELNVGYTRIIAPSDGIIARKSVEPGQFVMAGQPLFGFVSSSERWVTANLKETELSDVSLGKKVIIEVDAFPKQEFEGEVESLGPSTGAIFSLLPPDNATGNFTKVVQRVPVRIRFTNVPAADLDRLQAGLSAVVSIRIH